LQHLHEDTFSLAPWISQQEPQDSLNYFEKLTPGHAISNLNVYSIDAHRQICESQLPHSVCRDVPA